MDVDFAFDYYYDTYSAPKNCSNTYLVQGQDRFDPTTEESAENLYIMKIIDQTHLAKLAWRYRKMTYYLSNHYGCKVNKKRVHRLMRLMDITALYSGSNRSKKYHNTIE